MTKPQVSDAAVYAAAIVLVVCALLGLVFLVLPTVAH